MLGFALMLERKQKAAMQKDTLSDKVSVLGSYIIYSSSAKNI